MGRLDGKVAFITGAARGQGRSHALRLAQEGADIIAIDVCEQIDSIPYPMATEDDLAQTVRQVEAIGRRIVATQADVRDFHRLDHVLRSSVAELGSLDIVVANAGIYSHGASWELTDASWSDVIDVNLTGAWHTAKAAIPHVLAGGRGGSFVLVSSTAGLIAGRNSAHYAASKHGIVGLMRSLALELAPHMIRVNSVHPTSVDTAMIHNASLYKLFRPDVKDPGRDDVAERFLALNALPVPWVAPSDVSNAVLFLTSNEARYVTGVALPIDAGCTIK